MVKKTYYIKRRGALVFWRVGRISCSSVLSSSQARAVAKIKQVVSHGSEFRVSYYSNGEVTTQPSLLQWEIER